jgi:hypothetical protein
MPDEEKVTPKKVVPKKKLLDPKDLTTCEATARMLVKARNDGVELAFDRAQNSGTKHESLPHRGRFGLLQTLLYGPLPAQF